MFADLRAFLSALEEADELERWPDPVHWDIEAAAAGCVNDQRGGKALWFDNVRRAEATLATSLFSGGSLLGAAARRDPWARIGLAMGLDRGAGYMDVLQAIVDRKATVITPMEVGEGSVTEEVHYDREVDLWEFPWPRLSALDGGRYITWSVTVAKDPEGGWVNWGTYRWMIASERTLVGGGEPGKHIRLIEEKYRQQGKPMPVAVVIGGPPSVFLAGASPVGTGVDEAMLASALGQEPLQLVKGRTVDLLVPADAEIVIEGEAVSAEEANEGPFTGGPVLSGPKKGLVLKVKCISHRTNPVIPFVSPAAVVTGVNDFTRVVSILESARLWEQWRMAYSPIRWIYVAAEASLGLCVVSAKVPYNGWVARMARAMFASSRWFDKMLVVDDDVPPVDLESCLNDMIQKANPSRDWTRMDDSFPRSLVALYEGGATSGRLIIDATWPLGVKKSDLPVRTTFEDSFPLELQQRVVEGWADHYGLPGQPLWLRR